MAQDLYSDPADDINRADLYSDAPAPGLRAASMLADGVNPDQYAKLRKDASDLGHPIAAAEALPAEVQREARIGRLQQDTSRSPVLQRKYSDADFNKLAQDDSSVLGTIGDALVSTAKYITSAPGNEQSLGREVVATGHTTLRQAAGLARFGADNAASALDVLSFGTLEKATSIGGNPLRRVAEGLGMIAEKEGALANAAASKWGKSDAAQIGGGGLSSGIQSFLQNGTMAAAAMAVAPEIVIPLMLYTMAGMQGGESYQKALEKGASQAQANILAMGDATAEYIGEKYLGMGGFLEKVMKGSSAKSLMTYEMTKEILGESGTTVWQNFNEWTVLNPKKSAADFLSEQPAAIAQTIVATLVGGGGQVALSKVMENAIANTYKEQHAQQAAEDAAAHLQQLMALAAQSKLRERSPQTFAEAAQEMADHGGAPAQVRFDARTLGEVLSQEDLAALPSVASQMQEALATGGEVTVPLGELLSNVSGTPLEQKLTEHMRVGDNELSQAEAKEASAQAESYLQTEAQRVIEGAADSVAHKASADVVKQKFMEQLTSLNRWSADVNDANATIASHMYTALAGQLGVTPEQAYEMHKIHVTGVNPAEANDSLSASAPGALSVEGYHFSKQARPVISGHAFGTGLKGSNRELYQNAEDKRLRQRSYFYVNTGNGITPEAGVGGIGHRAQLTNIYDADADPLRIKKGGTLAFESAVLDHGYSGYLTRMSGTQPGQVTMLGDNTVNAEVLGPMTKAEGRRVPEPVARESRGRDQVVDRLNANKMLPSGSMPLGKWAETLQTQMPAEYDALAAAGVFSGNLEESVYKSALVKAFESMTPSESYGQSATLRNGQETLLKYGLAPGGKYNTRDIAAALEARQREKYGKIDPADRSPESAEKIAAWMAEEVRFEMLHPRKSGVGWYSYKFQRALDTFGEVFPELKKDKDARATLTALIAITSDGQKVVPNFRMAVDLYRNFRETGKFTTDRGHARMDAIQGNIDLLQLMLNDMGPKAARKYLLQEASVSSLRKMAKAEGIEFKTDYQAHVKLPMAAVTFGPKLGAFYANLMGSHGYLTMDRWWSRTFNRYRGTLLQAPTRDGLDRIKELNGHPEWSDDEAISATVEPRNSYAAKNFKNGTELEKASNTVYKAAFENLEDTPFNATDRTFMLDAVDRAQKMLAAEGRKISVADIQAVLWYYEKRLYGELGARQTADVSYEDAAGKVATELANAGGPSGPSAPGDSAGAVGDVGQTETDVSEEAVAPGLEPFIEGVEQGPTESFAQGGLESFAGASLDDFTPENIGGVLAKGNWSILTAENPMGVQATPEVNAAKMASLKRDLDAIGASYTEAVGKYGNVENSLVVTGIDAADAVELGRKYAQDSVLTNRGLVYPRDGSITPTTGQVEVFDEAPDDFYTTIPSTGAKFAIGLDFADESKQHDPLAAILTPETYAEVKVALAQYVKGVDATVSPLDRAAAEALLEPVMDQARRMKPAFDETIRGIAAEVGVEARLPGIKKIGRAAEKLVTEISRNADGSMNPGGMWDLLRSTIVVAKPSDVQAAIEAVKQKFEVVRVKDRFANPTPAGYRDVLMNVRLPSGLMAEVQINVPAMIVAKSSGHKLYDMSRSMQAGDERDSSEALQTKLYSEAFAFAQNSASAASALEPLANQAALGNGLDGSSANTNELSASLSTGTPSTSNTSAPGGTGNGNINTSLVTPIIAEANKYQKKFLGDRALESLTPEEKAQYEALGPNSFKQPNALSDRGAFVPKTMTLVMLEKADLSTFHHEMAHAYLEILANIASQPGAPAQLVHSMGVLLKWFKIKDLNTWNGMTLNEKRISHEKFAEHYEAYLFSGKAPSMELQPLFRRFASWMKNVYKSVKAVLESRGKSLSPEVLGVYDRMLATEHQIEEAEAARKFQPLFKSAEAVGMLPHDWAQYTLAAQEATETAIETLQTRSLRDMKWAVNAKSKAVKALQKDVAAKIKATRAEVADEVAAMPVYAAKSYLDSLKGERTDADLQVAAELFHYGSVDEMLRDIKEAFPIEQTIDGMTDQRLLERYGDLVTPKGIEDAANEAIHNEARARFVATELKALSEGMRLKTADRSSILEKLKECLAS